MTVPATPRMARPAAIKPWAFVMWPAIRLGAARFVTQIGEELAHYVETGTPHPRKIAAMKKTEPRESV